MFKSFAPFEPHTLYPDLSGAYERSAFNSLLPSIQAKGQTTTSFKSVQTEDGIDTFELEPGKLSFKQRILNLIRQNQPDKAMDMMTTLSHIEPEQYESLADDIYAAFWRDGFDDYAQKLAALSITDNPETPAQDKLEATHTLNIRAPSF